MAKRSKKKVRGAQAAAVKKVPAAVYAAHTPTAAFIPDWLWGVILSVIVFLAYSPVWRAGFVWDDEALIVANPVIVGPLGLKEIWTTEAARFFPMTMTTYWFEHALWGLNPLPYHLVNVFFHAAGALVLWRLLKALQVPGAWLGSAFWALHPVQAESVAWLAELKNTQSGFFFLLSVLFFVKWLKAKDCGGLAKPDWNYACTFLFAVLALLSKSSTVIFPLALCLCAWWVEGRWKWQRLLAVVPIFLLSLFGVVMTIWAVRVEGIADPAQWSLSWPQRFIAAGDAMWFYLGKLVWPIPLITIYPRPKIDPEAWTSYLGLIGFIVGFGFLWFKRNKWSQPYFFVLAYFTSALLPVLGLVYHNYLQYSSVADHFQYLASMGPMALVAVGIVTLGQAMGAKLKWLQLSFCIALLFVLGILTWNRAGTFENSETLWTDTLAKNPECWAAHNNLGEALLKKGQIDDAIGHFQTALDINPADAEAHDNLALAFMQQGRVDDGMTQSQQALEISPNDAKAHFNLGTGLLQKRRVDDAAAQFEEALKINPAYAEAENNLGVVFFRKGKVDDAVVHYQTALDLKPTYLDARVNLGLAQARQGDYELAIDQFQEAVRQNPDNGDVRNDLANVQAMARQKANPK